MIFTDINIAWRSRPIMYREESEADIWQEPYIYVQHQLEI